MEFYAMCNIVLRIILDWFVSIFLICNINFYHEEIFVYHSIVFCV
jgi:hypothetical protein